MPGAHTSLPFARSPCVCTHTHMCLHVRACVCIHTCVCILPLPYKPFEYETSSAKSHSFAQKHVVTTCFCYLVTIRATMCEFFCVRGFWGIIPHTYRPSFVSRTSITGLQGFGQAWVVGVMSEGKRVVQPHRPVQVCHTLFTPNLFWIKPSAAPTASSWGYHKIAFSGAISSLPDGLQFSSLWRVLWVADPDTTHVDVRGTEEAWWTLWVGAAASAGSLPNLPEHWGYVWNVITYWPSQQMSRDK